MTAAEFTRRVSAAGLSGRAVAAARRVLVEGLGVRAAARECEVNATAVSRAVAKIRALTLCRCCGQPR